MVKRLSLVALILVMAAVTAVAEEGYKKPPQAVLDVLNAPLPPQISVSPSRDYLLLADRSAYPPIADLAQPMLRLAGLRINPNTNGPHRGTYYTGLTLKKIADGTDIRIALPANAKISLPRWSPDGKSFAFTNTIANGIELWIGDAAGKA